MRVQCGVCEKAEAVLICCADEAALCAACDVKVHAANKLASKHQRVSLSKPSGDHPRCDICQEKSAFFFCIEDRALLCRNCDLSIHSVNSLAANHRRFLVTGLRVGLNALVQDPAEAQSTADSGKSSGGAKVCGNLCTRQTPENSFTISVSTPVSKEDSDFGSQDKYVQAAVSENSEENYNLRFIPASKENSELHVSGNRNQRSTSKVANTTEKNTISEFLTEGVPGWRVDEFFNMPEISGGYSLADIVSSKGAMNEFDWAADLDLFEEQSVHQVPDLQSAPLYTGASRPSKPNAVFKVKAKQDVAIVSDFEDCFTVPDFYEDFGVPSPSYKRRKVYYET